MAVNKSAEDYLEAIYFLSKKLPVVRSIDIAHELNFTKPSVSIAMKNLKNLGMIEVSDAGYITLTASGKEIALTISERHEKLTSWLISLGVSEEVAMEDACKIEHVISAESFEAIKRHAAK